jgi:undecaprenyl-diphosphatase
MLSFFKLVAVVGDTAVILVLAATLSLILYFVLNKRKESLIVISAFSLSTSITYVLKHLFKIPRPENMLVLEEGYRFPSGHATAAGVVFALSIYFANKYWSQKHNKMKRWAVYTLATIWLAISMYGRLYLQVHLPIDVICGAIVGVVSTILMIHVFNKYLEYRNGKDWL